MLVIPGGAYAFWSEREGEPVALRYYAAGFDCFVLEYDIAPVSYPAQILQAGMAMLYLRKEAEALSIDPAHIAAVGFSAGGHLCGCISYLWDDAALRAAFGEECARIRPDAAILSYPVVSADKEVSHADSFRNFCGNAVSPQKYSLEKHIRPAAPPTFVWATSQDALVPPQNALLLYASLLRQGVAAELHLFDRGPHGMSVCAEDVAFADWDKDAMAHAAHWLPLSLEFLRARGFVPRRA